MATETRKSTAAIAPFGLRMQPDLRDMIEKAAEANGRSMNAEIVSRLGDSFLYAQTAHPPMTAKDVDRLVHKAAMDSAKEAATLIVEMFSADGKTIDQLEFRKRMFEISNKHVKEPYVPLGIKDPSPSEDADGSN